MTHRAWASRGGEAFCCRLWKVPDVSGKQVAVQDPETHPSCSSSSSSVCLLDDPGLEAGGMSLPHTSTPALLDRMGQRSPESVTVQGDLAKTAWFWIIGFSLFPAQRYV